MSVPIHQWTNDSGEVLIVKCLNRNGKGYDEFEWPQSGPVTCPKWTEESLCLSHPDPCSTGGFFGWPWGLNLGGGKDPDYSAEWIVFSAAPECIVDLDDKCKAGPTVTVVYRGDWLGAMLLTASGRESWIAAKCAESAAETATGYRGVASSTGDRGVASSTGERGVASSTGYNGVASSTGERGAASTTGYRGVASSTGYNGVASSTGDNGVASSTGYRGAASSTGYRGAASSTSDSGVASSTGYRGTASSTGDRGVASSTGYGGTASSTSDSGVASSTSDSGVASSTGDRGVASSTGYRGVASTTGYRGVACLTGENGTLEVGANAAGVCAAESFLWIVHLGAVVLHRWEGGHKLLTTDGLEEGQRVSIIRGEIHQ